MYNKFQLENNKLMLKKKTFIYFLIYILIFFILATSFKYILCSLYLNEPNHLSLIFDDEEKTYAYDNLTIYTHFDEVSSAFIKTLITIEDKHFFNHHGFDKRMVKAILKNIKAQDYVEGGSTITQQLAKMIFLSNKKTLRRKYNEAIITKKIEHHYSKKMILEMYINNLYFAHNIYGIYNASRYYFNKLPSELTYADSCILVGIINAPNRYSPLINYDLSLKKAQQIALRLLNENVINYQEYYQIIDKKYSFKKIDIFKDNFNYYYQGLIEELKSLNLYQSSKFAQGLNIYTYYDKNIDNLVKNAIKKYVKTNQICTIILKPNTGKILSLHGGKSYQENEYNIALQAKLNIGSTIKPFIYYSLLKNNISPLSLVESSPHTFYLDDGTTYTPRNANSIYAYRKINMIEALAYSDNIYAVKALEYLGIDYFITFLKTFDIDINTKSLTLALGNVEINPLKLASMYNTLASLGRYYKPSFIDKVYSKENVLLYQNPMHGEDKLKEHTTLILNHLLKSPLDKNLETYTKVTMSNYPLNKEFALKTGTTENASYVIGYNCDYLIFVLSLKDKEPLNNEAKLVFQYLVNNLKEDHFFQTPSTKKIKFYNPLNQKYSKAYYLLT